jgi:REP element-mobilizing transposase RayT
MHFEFFDPTQDIYVHYRRLPHWEQPGVMCFVTWRTTDSIPESTLKRWRVERAGWLRRHEIDPLAENWRELLRLLPRATRKEYHEHFTDAWMESLDQCHGACVLKRPELSQIVADGLLHFDGHQYVVSDFVVMPNHVHVLVQFPDEGQLKCRCRAWKHFTAREINHRLQASGRFWQVESFDHLVRSPEQFQYLRDYIFRNGPCTGLKAGEFHYYRRPEGSPLIP